MLILYIFIFLASAFLLGFSSKWLIGALSRVALFLKVKEFIVAFFVMAFAVTLPNLILGITAAVNKIPELSFGDVIGGNIIDLTLVLGLGALLAKEGLQANSKTVQKSSIYTIFIAVLPLLLIADGKLSRIDGVILLLSFFLYVFWIFSKRENFEKVYENCPTVFDKRIFLKDCLIVIGAGILLYFGAKGLVLSASFFSSMFHLPLAIIGLLIVGLGNCMPETFFTIQAAKKGENWMIIGDLMGGVIMCATLVLGTVALIRPIIINDFSPFAAARVFMILAALFFLFSVRTGQKITKREGVILVFIYIFYLLTEILIGYISL